MPAAKIAKQKIRFTISMADVPKLDGREFLRHKSVELLDAEKVLKTVEFCAPTPSSTTNAQFRKLAALAPLGAPLSGARR
jgi:hypothetical protein